MYAAIEETDRKALSAALIEVIEECKTDDSTEEYGVYEVEIQHLKFKTIVLNGEMPEIVSLAIDLVEEFKNINNNGVNRERYEEIEREIDKQIEGQQDVLVRDVHNIYGIFNTIKTDKLDQIIARIFDLRKVGGAYMMLVSKPVLLSAIRAVFEKILDNFDNEGLYVQSVYFLLRAIMKVNSNEHD